MNIRATVAVLLTLCGVGVLSSAQAADFRCLVYSGADGTTLEKTTNKDGGYEVTAADLKAAEAAALKKGAQYKKGVTLTRAECTAAGGTATAAAAAPESSAPAPTPPAGDLKQFYCMVYQDPAPGKMGLEHIPAPAGKAAPGQKNIWLVSAASSSVSEETAVALAKSEGKPAVDALCEATLQGILNP